MQGSERDLEESISRIISMMNCRLLVNQLGTEAATLRSIFNRNKILIDPSTPSVNLLALLVSERSFWFHVEKGLQFCNSIARYLQAANIDLEHLTVDKFCCCVTEHELFEANTDYAEFLLAEFNSHFQRCLLAITTQA